MYLRSLYLKRHAATLVEFAMVGALTLLLLLGLLIGGMGVFRYVEVASLARECSRWASVHGKLYQQDTGSPAAAQQDIYNNVITKQAVGMDLSELKCTVGWQSGNSPYQLVNNQAVPNTVTVTISYQWLPEAFVAGPITLSSTSVSPMEN
jgi:hypothetical protein